MKIVILDTETTGLWSRDKDELDVTQPWAVQLGAVILNDRLEIVEQINRLLIPPEGAVWTARAVQMHGITPDMASANGQPTAVVLAEFKAQIADADVVAAYNLPYDSRIIRTSGERVGIEDVLPTTADHICIMEWASHVLGARYQLGQAYRKLMGKIVENAHDAFADTIAATEVFRALYMQGEN